MKKTNEYTKRIDSRVFEKTPKTVFAAIAVSAIMRDSAKYDATKYLLEEWWILHDNDIIPQKPVAHDTLTSLPADEIGPMIA
jgi:hypothetical protein